MKIDNYAVAINAQYYNLQFRSTNTQITSSVENFQKDDSADVAKVEIDSSKIKNTNMELSKELGQAVLKNIHNETQKIVGDRVEISSIYAESQSLNFSVAALIQADGKEMEISLDVSLSRSFVQKTSISMSIDSLLKDPLVISLDGTMPSLSSKTFSFDIDSDGKSDQVSQLNSGSGFLALDKNGNGTIDDGNELFGTKSGDGFADLSKYDDDKNGWIDENDAIFDKLQIWKKSDGKDELIGLGEVGIGAIFLGNTETPFSLKSNTNELLGEIRKSGFVLFENGRAGVISQIDLAVNDETKDKLNTIDSLQKNLNSLNIYSRDEVEDNSGTTDDKMQKIQAQIKSLEGELRGAKDSDKPGLQARIGALFAQMMALLEAEL